MKLSYLRSIIQASQSNSWLTRTGSYRVPQMYFQNGALYYLLEYDTEKA